MQKAHDSSKNDFWRNYPNINTPITQDELNRMEVSMDTIDDRVVVFDSTKANQTDLLQTLKTVTYNTTTGVFTFTWWNGTSTIIDLNIEKIPVSFSMSPEGIITMTTADGTTYTCDVSSLIKTYSFVNSTEFSWTVTTDASGNKSVSASLVNGSITGEKLEPNYLANVTAQAQAAASSAGDSEGFAEDSEAWAKGTRNGQDVPSTDETYHNNAKYWSEQAQSAASGQVQSDWNESDTTSKAYIKNKPTSMPASDVSEWAKAATKPTYNASEINAGTLAGQTKANATAVATLGTAQIRNIYAGTAEMTPGASNLAPGDIYLKIKS